MNNEKISKFRYVFEDTKITNIIDETNNAFSEHEDYYIKFYYGIWKLKKYCEQKTKDDDQVIFEYLAEDEKGEIVERKKKFSFNTMIKTLFNIDKTQLSRGLNILKRFSNFKEDVEQLDVSVKPEFINYSYSKLVELLPYQDIYINKLLEDGKITSNQSVNELRKVLKDKPVKIEFAPEPFDLERKEEYQLQDFRNYGRNDLIAIAYQIYQVYLRQKRQLKLKKSGEKI